MRIKTFAAGILLIALMRHAGAAERTLVNFARPYDATKIATQNARAEQVRSGAEGVLRVQTGSKGDWPGVTIKPPEGEWDLSPFAQVSVAIKNVGATTITVFCRVDNRGADGKNNCVTGQLEMSPGQLGSISVDLKRTTNDKMDGKLFGLRGYPVRAGGPGTIDPASVTGILLFVARPKVEQVFEIQRVRAMKDYVRPTAWTSDADPYFPFIDTFGQYKHKDWPGKLHNAEELQARRAQEAEELKQNSGPGDWDQYGGWAAGPKLKATGFFRAEKHQGKWWLVDPEGRLFFSHGVDCVGELDQTPIDERASWFEDFPGGLPEFRSLLGRSTALKGHYASKSTQTFRFSAANLQRKYGAGWNREYGELAHRRLRSWGLNTIANWSNPEIYGMRRTPYTDTVSTGKAPRIEGGEGYWGKFPDVYAPEFERAIRDSAASKRGRSAGDPWCLGYFSDNEMSWGDEVSHALAALESPASQPAKLEFIRDLKAKYGEIGKLNEAWGANHASWDGLLESRVRPDRKKADKDLRAFYAKTAELYFTTVRESVKQVAPGQLYLGCRFAWVNPSAAAVATMYCDVVSYNIYKKSVDQFVYTGGADVPLIIGEFHFGALDRGMFHTGLVPVADQAARAQAYTDFLRAALRHPQFVGTAWFKYQDEPLTGRVLDEENYQIGFTDVTDTPYPELVAASRALGAELYEYRLKAKE